MGVVLIHIQPGRGPIGAWREHDGGLVSCYPNGDAAAQHTALQALRAKADAVPMPVWMNALADRVPHADDYETVVSDEELSIVLARFVAAWKGSATP